VAASFRAFSRSWPTSSKIGSSAFGVGGGTGAGVARLTVLPWGKAVERKRGCV